MKSLYRLEGVTYSLIGDIAIGDNRLQPCVGVSLARHRHYPMKPLYRLEGVTYSLRGSIHINEEPMIFRRYYLLIREDTPFSPSETLFFFQGFHHI